ncbi:MAG TPA: Amuc_1099 family pilus-like system protein [Prosthecobacter sp.]|nr:Amuc_1099 family pilus-like system protein [Prosthecobacter sp.]
MQKRKGNYEKVLLIIASLAALGTAGYLIWTSQKFDEKLVLLPSSPKNNPGTPPTAMVDAAMKRLQEKVTWLSPVVNNKAVPLNKSVLLIRKDGQLFDLQVPEPVLRPPMTNEFLVKNDLPNIDSPNVGDLDPDSDGFSNVDEFTKNTNPRDPASHPPVTDKLFLKARITHDYILKLNSSSPPFQVQRVKPEPKVSKFVSPGDEFGFERNVVRFKVGPFEQKLVPDPNVGEKDVSELTITDLATNQTFKLVRGTDYNLAEYEAEFEFLLRDVVERRKVKKGETFQIPGMGVTYKVIEIEETKATIAPVKDDLSHGEPLVVPKR